MAPITPKLTLLKLDHNPLKGIPESFFVHMRALTFLDLSWTAIERLPESVSHLENLRALLLGYCKRLTYVPSVAKLTKLRVLNLYGDWKLDEMPKGIEKLKCLEKLPYGFWKLSDMTGFHFYNKFSESLTRYKSSYYFYVLHNINESENIYYDMPEFNKEVLIKGVDFAEDETIVMLPTTIQCLTMEGCDMKGRGLGDVIPNFDEAADLRKIDMFDCGGLEYIFSSSSGPQQGSSIFPRLESLILKGLPDLKRIIKLGGCSFSHLRYLDIRRCPKIKVVLPLAEQHFLPNHEIITVEECEGLEEIFASNSGTATQHKLVLTSPYLRFLKLIGLPKLGSIYRGLLCYSRARIEARNCPKLRMLPLSSGLICDESQATMESIARDQGVLEMLERHYPKDFCLISDHMTF